MRRMQFMITAHNFLDSTFSIFDILLMIVNQKSKQNFLFGMFCILIWGDLIGHNWQWFLVSCYVLIKWRKQSILKENHLDIICITLSIDFAQFPTDKKDNCPLCNSRLHRIMRLSLKKNKSFSLHKEHVFLSNWDCHFKKFLKELMTDCYTKVPLCHISIRWVDCRHCHFDSDKPNKECICCNSILSILDHRYKNDVQWSLHMFHDHNLL